MLAGDNTRLFAETRAGLTRDVWFTADHQIIFDCLIALADKGSKIDAILLRAELERRQLLEEVGGMSYIGAILSTVPSPAHGPHYSSIVREKYQLRLLIAKANDIIRAAYAPTDGDQAAAMATKYAGEIAQIGATGQSHEIITLGEAAEAFIESRTDEDTEQNGLIKTGLRDLDKTIGGLRRGRMTIGGGRAGMGKSQLAKQILGNVASSGIRCGLVAIEEDREKIVENYLSAFSGVENHKIAYRKETDAEMAKVTGAIPELQRLPIRIIDTAFALGDIIAAIHQLVLRDRCELIAVDHLHLIDGQTDAREGSNRNAEVSAISRALKMCFRRLNVASFVTAQLNRGADGVAANSRRPVLRDLRDSGTLEQDGDLIILLHREDYYRYAEPGFAPTHQLEAIVAKNKSGPPAIVPLYFDGEHQRVLDWDKGAMTPFD
jgi:replicative DNA helicase